VGGICGACGGGEKYIYKTLVGGTRKYLKEFRWEGVGLIICQRTGRGDGLL